MTKAEIKYHDWHKNDRIFIITTKFKDSVPVPEGIEEAHFLDNPGYIDKLKKLEFEVKTKAVEYEV